jgi:excisionase family DNA binding protein
LKVSELARLLDLKPGSIYEMVERRIIPHLRLGSGTIRFDPVLTAAWIDDHTIAASPPKTR